MFSWNTGFEIRSFALLPTYNLIKELSNGGGSFIFNTFRPFTKIFYTDDYMLETINFMKATYVDTSLLHYLSFNGDIMKFTWYFLNFSLLLTLVVFLNKFCRNAFDIVSETSVSEHQKILKFVCINKKKYFRVSSLKIQFYFFENFLWRRSRSGLAYNNFQISIRGEYYYPSWSTYILGKKCSGSTFSKGVLIARSNGLLLLYTKG